MKFLANVALTIAAAAALTGCGTTVHFASTNTPPRPLAQRTAESVHVFTTGGPARPYAEIGLIQARQDSPSSLDEMPDILAEMRQEAGRRGCDGIVITGRADETSGGVFGNQYTTTGYTGTSEGLMGACIVYVDPPAGDSSAAIAPPNAQGAP